MVTNLVSIVIPTYNQSLYIIETLESVLSQTYSNLEIIISDDCSTDGTIDILKSYTLRDKRIVLLISERNQGISKNFNKAFDACRGKYVAFLGGDDLMHPTKIEKQVAFLEEHNDHSLCMHDMVLFDENNHTSIRHSEKYFASTNPLDWCLYSNWFFSKRVVGILPSSCLARSEYYLSARYDERLKYKHELLFHLDLYCNNSQAQWGYLNEVLGTYRIHQSNFSSNPTNTSLIPADASIYYAIAEHKHPQLTKAIKRSREHMWFQQLLFNWAPQDLRKHYQKQFLIEAGIIKFLYLLICKMLLKVKLLFIITKPLRLLAQWT